MIHEDIQFMKKALDVARLGAGLVSPNPMVGAVLVKKGKIVGVGHHRYDRLKHAESNAIEMAGEASRGSTLYCSLEPCCHHGRTPPCTDAVIAAGITRAVIAIKDPNPLVDGRGIDQLRAAGIDVEVGLCEEEAARLNECYFKFIAGEGPFVHGVIEYHDGDERPFNRWTPSDEFLAAASEYDSLILGSRPGVNRLLVEARLERDLHRSFVVAGGEFELERCEDLFAGRPEEDWSLITIAPKPVLRSVDGSAGSAGMQSPDLESTLLDLARMGVTGVLVLPGIFDPGVPRNFEQLDKLTFAVPGIHGPRRTGVSTSGLAFGDIEFDLEEVSISNAGNYTEFTGYPQLRGVA